MPLLLTPPYVISNRVTVRPAFVMPQMAPDTWIPFAPSVAPVYLALFPLMWWAVLAQPNPSEARRVVVSAAACAWTAGTIFVLAPTAYPRPPNAGGLLYSLITWLDTPRNACPSLHGTYSVHAAIWLSRARAEWRWLASCCAAVILVATLAVRQHGVFDLLAGGFLAVIACRVWRPISQT